ncbi:cysteine--tRNA ligase [Balneatrix alpica]|uniref:Cysteine--tRNA ligase n=1 Tax=Balneatrix alpica TaxID=75684 RepID=A0ABV5Z734_9GAMM|nr:cysteine--tRNA ligase [Balneatrix alpica]
MQIYNTLSKGKETFKPLEPGKIKMYVCGITVYDFCHIGHARVMVSFDVITRYLRYRGYDVTYVRNITDVDDKIIKRAAENQESVDSLTERMIAAMHEDEDKLGVLRPDLEPRAMAHIEQIIEMVATLIDKGYAYQGTSGDVYYRVERFADYGKLTNRNLEDLRAGARVEVAEDKESPLDFVLWKHAKEGEVSWDSPWGKGRPGWHIECSAMSKCCLGETFDIHGGGPDLPFPHHENEIAQSEAANGKKFVNYWMHAGAVRVDNEKMSKSLGNFFTIREVLEKYNPEVVRYLLISTHYRSQIDYSEDSLREAQQALERFYNALRGLDYAPDDDAGLTLDYEQRFQQVMDDDFNTREALAVMFDLVREINRLKKEDAEAAAPLAALLVRLGGIMGILQQDAEAFLQGGELAPGLDANAIEALIEARAQAKRDRDFARADQIRDELKAQGIILNDSRDGTTWTRDSL